MPYKICIRHCNTRSNDASNLAYDVILFLISATAECHRGGVRVSPSYICEDISGEPAPSIFLSHRTLRDTLRQNVDITATRRSIYHCAGCA